MLFYGVQMDSTSFHLFVSSDEESCNNPGPAYIAMYQYDADDGDYNDVDVEEILTFDVHDVIYFLGERRGRWMKGRMRNTGEIGWFPSTHVREGVYTSHDYDLPIALAASNSQRAVITRYIVLEIVTIFCYIGSRAGCWENGICLDLW